MPPHLAAQQAVVAPAEEPPVNAADFGLGGDGVGNQAGGAGNAGFGGAASADFDSLIDLITSTVEAESWAENGTGEGEIMPFPTGVYVDASGALQVVEASRPALTMVRRRGAGAPSPAALKALADTATDSRRDARTASELRFVSLPRLEAAIAARQARHERLDPEMLTLAGLQQVDYVLVYPATQDLVLAGPAGDWRYVPDGSVVSADTGRPVVRLDDLLTLMRRNKTHRSKAFGCAIVPRQEALARTQEFVTASAAEPLAPGRRRAWLGQLRGTLGQQDIDYFGIDPDTRVAGVLLAADYHMKLVGMGLAPGVPGVKSYLSTVRLDSTGAAPPMSVLRWWFNMPASKVEADQDHQAFALPARCVEVLSENELLAARGERIHTGQSEELTRRFAESFTREFEALADKYPIYGQLERIFELAMVLSVIDREGLADRAEWTPTLLADADRLRLPKTPAPRTVETVINHRVIGGRRIIAGISGGVWVASESQATVTAATGEKVERLATLKKEGAVDEGASATPWWWD